MATARKVQTDYKVELLLNQQEAETLRAILNQVGGSPEKSRRKHADSMIAALVEIGVSVTDFDISGETRYIYFK